MLSLSACATNPSALSLTVPDTFREACERPKGYLRTDGEVAQFIVRQELAIGDCDAKRRGLVDLIDGTNEALKPRKRLFGFTVPF